MEMVRRTASKRMKPIRTNNNFQSVMACECVGEERYMCGDIRGIENSSSVI